MGTNSALRASSLAIKRVMEGRIAHLGHQFGTSCLIPGNQKVREWIVKCLRQIDGLQIRHFVPHPVIKKWQLRGKQLCEGVPTGRNAKNRQKKWREKQWLFLAILGYSWLFLAIYELTYTICK
ncbi:uncharacterized protein OCT59_011619 [Rhizophagus irregularis]|uniref:uncharacterized protein n=1 Tax=Rhizophagus irregularis TaxID=588596 RepID=UPI00331CE2A8|nr:hypothetical protein OCT59_011619 [Rhizophagus irregularis]